MQITSSNYLKVPITPVLEKGMFIHNLPVWFEAWKEYSIA
jgi:hypothetical protein